MEYKFIGWCHDPIENHDKVWGVIYLEDKESMSNRRYYPGSPSYRKTVTFWGRRGKKLSTKMGLDNYDMEKLIREKQDKKNYLKIDERKLSTVYPEFEEDLEKTAVWAILCK